jgi:RHS repeat-associated protein
MATWHQGRARLPAIGKGSVALVVCVLSVMAGLWTPYAAEAGVQLLGFVVTPGGPGPAKGLMPFGAATPPSVYTEPLPSADIYSDSVGATPATFRADESGASTYSVPIFTPPGTAGLGPTLSLEYNSRASNGPMGPGWSLGGLSAISRCKRATEYGDGSGPFPAINFDGVAADQAYCLDSARLLDLNTGAGSCPAGPSGSTAHVFGLEVDPSTRVCGYTTAAITGYAYWLVQPKDGSYRVYGTSGNSALVRNDGTAADTTQVLSWSLNRIADAVGNTVEYSYTQSAATGELDIAQIAYTGKIALSDVLAASPTFTRATYASVAFTYATLPTASQRVDYVAGMKLALTQQLTAITVSGPQSHGGTPLTAQTVRTYHLTYGTPTGSGLAALTALQECAPGASGEVCYPSTRFTWNFIGGAPVGFPGSATAMTYSGLQYAIDYKVGDINGDGRQDLVWVKDQSCDSSGSGATRFQIMVSLSTSTGFAPAIASGVYLTRPPNGAPNLPNCGADWRSYHFESLWYLYDFSGDARDDLLASNGSMWNIYPAIASGTGYTFDGAHPVGTSMTSAPTDDGIFADFNGDGLPDLIHINSVGGITSNLLQKATSGTLTFNFDTTTKDLSITLPTLAGNPTVNYDLGFAPQPGRNVLNADLNGDGASDFLLKLTFDDGVCGGGGNKLARSAGNLSAQHVAYQFDPSSQPDAPSAPCPKHWYTFRNGGVQADNLLHFTYETDVGQTGNGNLVADGSYISLVDLNGDGQADLVYAKQPVAGTYAYYYRINQGKTGDAASAERFLAEQSTGLSLPQNYAERLQFLDVNGDHRTDILYQDGAGDMDGTGAHPLKALLWGATGFGAPIDVGSPMINGQDPTQLQSFLIDVEGKGAPDLVRFSGSTLSVVGYGPAFGGNDFVTQIVNGLGASTQVIYYPLSYAAGYTRAYDGPLQNWGRTSPVFDVTSAIWVVHKASSSAPTAASATAMSSVVYRYGGARIQSGGRGFLGFQTVQSENQQPTQDSSKFLVTTTEYRQDFPFIGRPDHTVVELETAVQADPCVSSPGDSCFVHPDPPCGHGTRCNAAPAIAAASLSTIGVGGQVLSDAVDSYASSPTFVGGPIQQPVMPYLSNSVEQKFDVISAGTLSHEITSSFTQDSNGNVTTSKIISSEPSVTIETKMTDNIYGCTITPPTVAACTGGALNTELQRLGRLSLSTVTSARPNQPTNKRRASFEYDPTTRLRIADIQGPYDDLESIPAVLKTLGMRTDLIRDANGNVTKQVQCSTYHFANRAACIDLTGFAQRGYDASDPTKFQRYAKWDFESLGRYALDKKVPFYSSSATGNLNEGIAEQVGASANAVNRDAFGNPLNHVSATGLSASMVYGKLGRAYFSEDTTGAFAKTTYAWCVDAATSDIPIAAPRVNCPQNAVYRILASSVASTGTYSGQSVAPTTWAYFDTLGREMLRTKRIYQPDPTTPSTLHWSSVKTTYDSTGRTVTTSTPYFSLDPGTTQAALNTRAGTLQPGAIASAVSTTTYDAVDRPTTQTHPEESANSPSASAWSFAELTTTATNPRTYATTQIKNARDEVTSVTAPVAQSNALTVSYTRDAVGNITQVARTPTDGNSSGVLITNVMGYDRLGRKLSIADPDKGSWTYAYNALGEQVSQTDAKGQSQTVYRDALGRIYQRNENRLTVSGLITEPTSLWEFDTALRSDSSVILGLLNSETNGIGGFARSNSYDDIGRVTSVLTSEDNLNTTERQTYDQFGRPYQHFDASTDPASANGELSEYSSDGYPIDTREASGGTTGTIYDQVLSLNQRGQVTQEEYHQNATLITTRGYDANTGRALSINTAGGSLQNWSYDYDKHSNLLMRWNQATGYNLKETLGYDNLDRLHTVDLSVSGVNGTQLMVGYDQLGNLMSKTAAAVQNWTYGTKPTGCAQLAGPHAASQLGSNTYCYDANGNQTSANFGGGQTRTITYTGYDLPAQITTNGTPSMATESFSYAPDRSMFKRVEGLNGPSDRIFCNGFDGACPNGNVPRSYYIGNVEVRMVGTTTTTKRYIGSYLVITTITTTAGTSTPTFAYLLRDVLGSIDVIVSETAAPIQHQGFDAWGNRRDASPGGQWTILPPASAAAFDTTTTYQGFTGHQQLDPVGLIHMRGRLYDPQLGRFIQADPMTEADATQGLNRYTYVQNNPLSMTDPSGYISFRQVLGIAIAVVAGCFGQFEISQGALGWAFAVAVAGGFLSAYVSTGSLKAGLWGAFAGGVFFGIGAGFSQIQGAAGTGFAGSGFSGGAFAANVAAHAAAGGVLNDLQGGNFGSGFFSAGVTQALSPTIENIDSVPGRVVTAALVGGTVSKAAGGSFANGAESAAFQTLFDGIANSNPRNEYTGSSPSGGGASGKSPVSDGIIGQMAGDGYGPPAPYPTIGAAATAGLEAAYPLGHKYEYAGAVITSGNGGYYATTPVTINDQHNFGFSLPPGETPVALYHTHPIDTNGEFFSKHDVETAQRLSVTSYIGVYSNNSISYFDPNTMTAITRRDFGGGTSMTGMAKGEVLCTSCFH